MADGDGSTVQRVRGIAGVKRHAAALMACVLGAVASVAWLRELPYSTSLIMTASEDDAVAPPGDNFALGPFVWRLAEYQAAPSLAPFRAVFGPACGALEGLSAARCVADIVKARSPRGEPRKEFVDQSFDPGEVLTEHLSGQPGHCMSRSFMTATALLAMGKPARIIQLLPPAYDGHNVTEIWDAAHGWLVFDPHFDSSILNGDDFISSVELSRVTGGLRWRRTHDDAPDPNLFAASTISIPDPWLYTRVGARVAPWPFRGTFVRFGPTRFNFGLAQRVAGLMSVGFTIAAFLVVAHWVRRSRAS